MTIALPISKKPKTAAHAASLADPVIDELKRLHALRHPLKPLVFASKTAFGRIDIKKAWQTALRSAGITNCRAHDMRHTFATFAAAQGASNKELATAMGHRTLQMLQRYTHLDVQITKKFSKRIADKIAQPARLTQNTDPITIPNCTVISRNTKSMESTIRSFS